MNYIAVIGLLLTCAIGIWKWVKRLMSERRKLADIARKQLDESIKNGDISSITAGFDRINRL